MANVYGIENAVIGEYEHKQSLHVIADDKKGNLIPKGVVSLDKVYDFYNYFQGSRNNKTHNSTMMYE